MSTYLTTKELAELLRLKERKIYDLVAAGTVPCLKVTGKLLFSKTEIEAWLDSGRQEVQNAKPVARPNVFLGSHDPLLEWALRQSRCGLATYLDGSGDGLSRFVQSEGIATGLHLFDAASQSWNIPAVQSTAGSLPAVLVRFAVRERGLVVRPGDGIALLGDLAGRRLAARHKGTGAQALWEALGGEIDARMSEPMASESDAAAAVAQLQADAAMGLPSVARQHGLDFVPLIEEAFDILVDRGAYFEPPLQTFFAFAKSQACHAYAQRLGGYDLKTTGKVIWNAP